MIRILYWNINRFSIKKVFDMTNWAKFDESIDQGQYILEKVVRGNGAQNMPDIFIIVEGVAGTGEVPSEGTTIHSESNTAMGFFYILEALRQLHSKQWCFVPPIGVGPGTKREAIGVYYNSEKLQFAGPYLYTQLNDALTASIRRSLPPHPRTITKLTEYSDNWMYGLSPAGDRTSSVRIGGNEYTVPESKFAGQWIYFRGEPDFPIPLQPPEGSRFENRIYFPHKANRGPFLTHFIDRRQGANNRLIKLMTIHTSPDSAADAVYNLPEVQEIQRVGDNEVSVIIGDFNVDPFQVYATEQAGHFYGKDLYARLPPNYVWGLDPRDAARALNLANQAYCLTHLLDSKTATPFNADNLNTPDPLHNVYPRYGYMGSKGSDKEPTNYGALDNVFTWYGSNAGGPAQNVTIVNTVVGTPYTQVPPPPGVNPNLTQGLTYPSSLKNPIPPGGYDSGTGDAAQQAYQTFLQWENFGVIYDASDHMALSIDV